MTIKQNLEQQLGFRIYELNGEYWKQPVATSLNAIFPVTIDEYNLWCKCLALTEQRERGVTAAEEFLRSSVEVNRHRGWSELDRLEWLAKKQLFEFAEAYASSRLAQQHKSFQSHLAAAKQEYSDLAEESENRAKNAESRLAEVSAQRDALQQALDMLGGPRRCENCATLRAEVTELRAEVERLTKEVNP